MDLIGYYFEPRVYTGKIPLSDPGTRFFSNFFFVQELWNFNVRYGSNGPLWSLCYEFWYYLIFGLVAFIKGLRTRIICVVALLVIAGPKIALLFPVWLLGVYVYKLYRKFLTISQVWRFVYFFAPITLFFVLRTTDYTESVMGLSHKIAQEINDRYAIYLAHASGFLTDYLVGILVAMNLFSIKYIRISSAAIPNGNKLFEGAVVVIRTLASMTYSLYALHFPLLLFLIALFPYKPTSIAHNITLLVSCWLIIHFISLHTESKKESYRQLLVNVSNRLSITG